MFTLRKLKQSSVSLFGIIGAFFGGAKTTSALEISGYAGPSTFINDPPPASSTPKTGTVTSCKTCPTGGPKNPTGSSTPFVTTWNGTSYEFENDFLFGKPDTAFSSYKEGHEAYTNGDTGGDTYIFQNQLEIKNGEIKLQIREIEPEESFIDRFEIFSLDIPEGYVPFVDGNLRTVRVFNDINSRVLPHTTHHYHEKENTFSRAPFFSQDGLSIVGEKDVLLQGDDEIILTIQPDQISLEDETYVRVASHFRDWTLGSAVPFSSLEKFQIKSFALVRRVPFMLTSALLVAGISTTSVHQTSQLSDILKTPMAYADKSGKCLFIVAQIDGVQYTLQTLYPRFVQTSNEVVQIPADLLQKAKQSGKSLTVRIKATKKHIVSSAYLFLSKDTGTQLTKKMSLVSATHTLSAGGVEQDVSKKLLRKDGVYTHTCPADVIDLIYSVPEKTASQRFYVLKADGFYTKLSYGYQWTYGSAWYKKLSSDSRMLIHRLKIRA